MDILIVFRSTFINEKGDEIGIDGVKNLITNYQNTSLKKELSNIIKDVETKSTKSKHFDDDEQDIIKYVGN